ncbi:nucleotide cyclase, partial [Baffinella frigidus]
SLIAPLAALFILPRPPLSAACVAAIRAAALAALIATQESLQEPPATPSPGDGEKEESLRPEASAAPPEGESKLEGRIHSMVNYLGVSVVLCAAAAWIALEALSRQAERTREMVFSMVPRDKEQILVMHSPDNWDQVGFTALSTQITAEELLDLVNAIFTSIDAAAACICPVWKVETIGDCWKAVVGKGGEPRDHIYKGTVLAYTILDVIRKVSTVCGLPLHCRVGVHIGDVYAAFVGRDLPRYHIYGIDTEIVNIMEASAEQDAVALSSAAAGALKDEWPHTSVRQVPGLGGTTECVCALALHDRAAHEEDRLAGNSLSTTQQTSSLALSASALPPPPSLLAVISPSSTAQTSSLALSATVPPLPPGPSTHPPRPLLAPPPTAPPHQHGAPAHDHGAEAASGEEGASKVDGPASGGGKSVLRPAPHLALRQRSNTDGVRKGKAPERPLSVSSAQRGGGGWWGDCGS